MEQPVHFMKQPLEQLKEIMLDYDTFCHTAEKLEWLDIEEQHDNWFRSYPLGIQLDAYMFPRDYIILHHIADVYTRAVLSSMAYYEEWEPKFWDMPRVERKRCLTEGKMLYKNYAVFRELRLVERNWDYLVNEIKYFAGENKVPVSEQKRYLDRFENAKVIELGGCYAGDFSYWAIKRNILLVVSCGCWD